MLFWYWFIFVVLWACCVGSFLNVVIYRLPAGESLLHPPSKCPRCGKGIKWYDNLPVISWFVLRGKCRNCGEPISFQYPLIEALAGAFVALLFLSYYVWGFREDVTQVVNSHLRFVQTWPLFTVHAVMICGLLAATLIDARLYIIPLSIPVVITLVAVVVLSLAVRLLPSMFVAFPVMTCQGVIDRGWMDELVHAGFGGVIGVGVANLLLWFKLIPRSFDESQIPEETLKALEGKEGPEGWYEFEHPRREVLKELLYLLYPVTGMVCGAAFGPRLVTLALPGWITATGTNYPPAVLMLGSVLFGFLVGGGIVWLVRIFGTLGFGKEAMGLGDVHLLAAVGACLGWYDTLIIFFIAPFIGISWTVLTAGISAMTKREVRMIPYGPHLAAATLVVTLYHRPIRDLICTHLLICC